MASAAIPYALVILTILVSEVPTWFWRSQLYEAVDAELL